ncbi:MAG: hypothetical protein ACOCP8_07640 [archaeon]
MIEYKGKTEKDIVLKYIFEGDKIIITSESWGFQEWKVKNDGTWKWLADDDKKLSEIYNSTKKVAEEILEYNPKKIGNWVKREENIWINKENNEIVKIKKVSEVEGWAFLHKSSLEKMAQNYKVKKNFDTKEEVINFAVEWMENNSEKEV